MAHIPHLQRDKKLARILPAGQPRELRKKKHLHLHLVGSIMSQQLSTKVADVFQQRFINLFEKANPGAADILAVPYETLRSIGLSHAKATYVHAVCRFFLDEKVQDKQLHALNNEDFIAYITQIKGVGRWTAEMLLMFAMGREDVFAVDDLGIQQAMIRLYGLDAADKKQLKADMLRISEKWKPYRTYACLYLWGWKDNTPAAVKKKSAQ
jgi:DNA-3-methyladenine glycosylase II